EAKVGQPTLRRLDRHAVGGEQAAPVLSGEGANESVLDVRLNAYHDVLERILPSLVGQHRSSERQARGDTGQFTPAPQPAMGFDCEIEQIVQVQYSVTPVRADRIGVTLAADPDLRSSL